MTCKLSQNDYLSISIKTLNQQSISSFSDGPSSTIGCCIMSALSVPPSQKTSRSSGLESIHNYANTLNPVSLAGTDQYSVVAIYTEVEVGTSEVDEDTVEPAEVQVQTDFYEEEIMAVSADNTTNEEATSLGTEDTSNTVDVAKALETLTKTFALRKESLGQDAATAKSHDLHGCDELGSENRSDEEQTSETRDQRENMAESPQAFQPETTEAIDLKDNCESFFDIEVANVSSKVPETEQSDSSAIVRTSARAQKSTSPSGQESCKVKRTAREANKEPKMYKNMLLFFFSNYLARYFTLKCLFLK